MSTYSRYVREAILYPELIESQHLLSEEENIIWRDCSTVVSVSAEQGRHHPMPPWINPYDARIIEDPETLKRWYRQGKAPTTMYQQRISILALRIIKKTWDEMKTPSDWSDFRAAKEQAVRQLRDDLKVFLTGFTDSRGNFWCGQCYSRCLFMDIGEELEYPILWVSKTDKGYISWLRTAQYHGLIQVEDGLRLAQRIKAERQVRMEALA